MRQFLYVIVLQTAMLCFTVASVAQVKTISGVVMSSENKPLPDVTVTVKGTSIAVITNQAGFFSVNAQKGQTLVFSYVGNQPQEVVVGDATTLNIKLAQGQNQLGEVVVTAHGIDRSRRSLGSSTPTVSGDEVSNTQRESFLSGLAGRVPGLQVNATSGNPGASQQIILRGIVSLD